MREIAIFEGVRVFSFNQFSQDNLNLVQVTAPNGQSKYGFLLRSYEQNYQVSFLNRDLPGENWEINSVPINEADLQRNHIYKLNLCLNDIIDDYVDRESEAYQSLRILVNSPDFNKNNLADYIELNLINLLLSHNFHADLNCRYELIEDKDNKIIWSDESDRDLLLDIMKQEIPLALLEVIAENPGELSYAQEDISLLFTDENLRNLRVSSSLEKEGERESILEQRISDLRLFEEQNYEIENRPASVTDNGSQAEVKTKSAVQALSDAINAEDISR